MSEKKQEVPTDLTGHGSAGDLAEELPGGSDPESLSYEDSRDALMQVVSQLERGGQSLERSLALWERGEALADRCQQWLEGARARIEAVRQSKATEENEDR